ncbi:MAG TPA: chemotaxis response regulator protein-glutamate methylesterase [Candidatus Solibacter sp.]|nr:chemotaxis response regulator protein-glutamate methylesterase [Candidatus Solibacter sp.]
MSQDEPIQPCIRVLIVDDSAFMRTALTRMISSEGGIEVAGTACNGAEALSKIPALDPDVVTLDVEMPGLNGVETLRAIMSRFPRPVIMVSSVTEKDADETFDALAAGAFDYVPKHLSSNSLDILHIREALITKIEAAAHVRRSRIAVVPPRKPVQPSMPEYRASDAITPSIVALGTSTGGPKALQDILPVFPRDLGVPILIVQHMPPGFTGPFAQRLNALCAIEVCEAKHQEEIRPGVVYIAPAGLHMTVERNTDSRAVISLNAQHEDCLHVPSVDVMMKSVAGAFRNSTLGVIMTGMGADGAEGMRAIFKQGGLTIGQDEASCAVYGMPRACAERGILNRIVPLSQIPAQIMQATRYRKRA